MPYASLWEALGGLGIFILGMKLMSEGLQKLAGAKIRNLLEKLTGTRLSSAFIGSCLSASLQSSSAAAILVIGFINATLGLFLKVITFPLTLVTFGLFWFVVNAAMLELASAIVPGFKVYGFFAAFLGAIVLSIVNMFLRWLVSTPKGRG